MKRISLVLFLGSLLAINSAFATTTLEGGWTSGCAPGPDGPLRFDAHFVNDTFTTDISIYADNKCATEIFKDSHHGVFAITGPGDKDPDAVKVTFTDIDASGNRTAAYELAKMVGDHLYFGLQPGDSEATRPTQVNMAYPFSRLPAH